MTQPVKYQGFLQRQQAFLEAYSKCGTVSHACQAAGISRTTVYNDWRQDPEFVEQMEQAHTAFGDYLQSLALQKVQRLESKDNLLHLAMLNAHVPHLYRPNPQVDNRQYVTQITINPPNPPQEQPQVTDSSHQQLPEHPESRDAGITDSVDDTSSE